MTHLSRICTFLSATAVLVLTALVFFSISIRYSINSPLIWAEEVSGYLLVAIVFLGTAHTAATGANIRISGPTDLLPAAWRSSVVAAATWLFISFAAVVAWQACVQVITSFVDGRRQFSILMTSTYLPQLPIAIGMVVLVADQIFIALSKNGSYQSLRGKVLAGAAALVVGGIGGLVAALFGFDAAVVGFTAIAVAMVCLCMTASGTRAALLLAAVLGLGMIGTGLGIVAVVCAFLFLAIIGVPIAAALGLAGVFGVFFLSSHPIPITIAERAWSTTNSFELTAVPLFILMGELLLRGGASDQLYRGLVTILGRMRGGLALSSIGACGIFSAVSGSSVATAATIGRVAAPQMIDRGYSEELTYGTLAAGGTLGILIPPSIVMLIYGSIAGVSIVDLFIACIIPGLLAMAGFMVAVGIWVRVSDQSSAAMAPSSWADKFSALGELAPTLTIVFGVLMSLYLGIATPTESAAVGCALSFLLCLFRRALTFEVLKSALLTSVSITSFILLITYGAAIFSYCMDYADVPSQVLRFVADMQVSPITLMLMIYLLYILLGMIMDGISMMIITLPIIYPLVSMAGFDGVWFGVVLVLLIEVGLITPPVGMNVFIIHGVAQTHRPGGIPIQRIFVGVLPFVGVLLALLLALLCWPDIATWLPNTMR